jgi:hypothetical protein
MGGAHRFIVVVLIFAFAVIAMGANSCGSTGGSGGGKSNHHGGSGGGGGSANSGGGDGYGGGGNSGSASGGGGSTRAESCTPGYSPCLAPASDYDCEGGTGDGPEYTGQVQVTGSDPYGLDTDGDGTGCE